MFFAFCPPTLGCSSCLASPWSPWPSAKGLVFLIHVLVAMVRLDTTGISDWRALPPNERKALVRAASCPTARRAEDMGCTPAGAEFPGIRTPETGAQQTGAQGRPISTFGYTPV